MSNLKLILDDSRRLTGKNLFMDQSGAILDAFVSGLDKQKVVDTWLDNLLPLLKGVGWAETKCVYRIFEDGVSLGFAAPLDALYAATEINEAAWEMTTSSLSEEENKESDEKPNLSELINTLNASIESERNPHLLELIQSSEDKNIAYLVDDDEFSLGYGTSSQTWNINNLPDKNTIEWNTYKTVPTALVTGTNGKSTSVRLSAHILKQAGIRCGVTSTDFIKVGDTIIDKGDYSGPGGARMLLRHKQTEAAVLEVARGGLLRRGLPIPQVDVALVTNVAEDHLGQYGINSVEALTAAKMMVAKAAKKQLILNADDKNIVRFAEHTLKQIEQHEQTGKTTGLNVSKIAQEPLAEYLPEKIVWFSLKETNPVIMAARENAQAVCFLRDDCIIYAVDKNTPENETVIINANDIPMTLQGAAVHNVQNALGAVALTKALGVNDSDIHKALSTFKSDAEDNPGRGNMFEYRGAKIILDFAHNVHSMDAMAKTLANIPAKRKILMLCHAGDRSNAEIKAMTTSSMAMKPDLVWVCELPKYLRGREIGELPKVITAAVIENGLSSDNIYYQDNLLKGAEDIIQQLQVDDLVFMMALSDRDEIAALLLPEVSQELPQEQSAADAKDNKHV
ncbi:Mur ligase family protein [uncultured Cocleimonas sp.]|uniref:Mur ligase family protein n=1 Tax=uncultured Cocleimonas sp. TaxID=1051587 RepID=UPI002618B364|nr:Mur ligase family protein [uncultured Cocleimonas sp.]